jgi:hypothetical protein
VRTGHGADIEAEPPHGLQPFAIVDTLADAADVIVADAQTSRQPE